MTVEELIKELQGLPKDLKIIMDMNSEGYSPLFGTWYAYMHTADDDQYNLQVLYAEKDILEEYSEDGNRELLDDFTPVICLTPASQNG